MLGCTILLFCPLLYTLLVALAVSLKLTIAATVSCDIPFPTIIFFIGSRFPSNSDLGWYLIASSFPLLGLRMLVKSIEFFVRILSLYLDRWDLDGKIDLYSIVFTQLVGAVLLVDIELYRVRMVYPLLFIII